MEEVKIKCKIKGLFPIDHLLSYIFKHKGKHLRGSKSSHLILF